MYNECISITRQFSFCPNCFRVDLYKGCDFGCKYCFANMDWAKTEDCKKNNWDLGDINKIRRIFHTALDTNAKSKSILVELIRHKVPIHCGGMSDPFQKREWKYHLTEKLIDISNKYDYPIQFSTKADSLPQSVRNKLNPKIHAFQVSICGWDDEYVRKWELNTPSAKNRLDFVKQLRDKGFWCSVRIQPVIDLVQCEKLCNNLGSIPSYVTLEHFNCIYDNHSIVEKFTKLCSTPSDYIMQEGKIVTKQFVKLRNIQVLKSILNNNGVKVGIGDNDLHYMSDTRCCCGTDTIGSAFDNYLKYNLTYMSTGEFGDEWVPECDPRKHINHRRYYGKINCKQYVNDYIERNLSFLGSSQDRVCGQIFKTYCSPLFK